MKKEFDDRFLALWLSGSLSDQEVQDRIGQKDFEEYKDIRLELSTWKVKPLNVEESFNTLKEKKGSEKSEKGTVRTLNPRKWISIAASLALFVGVYFLYQLFLADTNRIYATNASESLEVSLPDGSAVTLGASSTLTFDEELFLKERSLKMTGRAFFQVEKGSQFTVGFPMGKVQVVGTAFNVVARKDLNAVECYEGKVLVYAGLSDTPVTLEKGDAVKYEGSIAVKEEYSINEDEPSWILGFERFKNAPLKEVIIALEAEFGVSIQTERGDIINRKYSGGFSHDDIDKALKTVFEPLGITYVVTGKEVILK